MPKEPSDGEKAVSQLAEILSKLKSEGFSTVAELITAFHQETAEKVKAVEARDKFNDANDNFRASLRDKGGTIASQEQEIEQLKKELEQEKGKGGTPTPAPGDAKKVDEELEEVEKNLTSDQKKHADELLEKMKDEDAALVAGDKKTRLAFLKGMRDDPKLKSLTRPKSFWGAEETPTPGDGKGVYETLLERIPNGPSGPSRRPGEPTKEPTKQKASWMNG
jgi:hypothetical protein